MKKIALFLPSLRGGGAERVMLNLALGLSSRGYSVHLVLAQAVGPLLDQVPAGVRVIDLHAQRVLFSLPALIRYLRTERPAAMLSALPHINHIALAARFLGGVKMRLIVSEHNVMSREAEHAPLIDRLFVYTRRFFYPFANAVVAVSNTVAEDLIASAHLARRAFTIVYNPIFTPQIIELAQKPLTHEWFQQPQPPVILAVGRLSTQKDYPTLLKAFAYLCVQRPVRLMILGEGPLRAELESLTLELKINNDVLFAGFDGNPFRYMARCGVFALASTWEGFGNVIVEALACGAQVVSTNCPGGPAEILNNGEYGWLVPVGDATALAAALEDALDHPMPREKLIARAQDFSIDKITEEYLRVLLPEAT